MGLWRCLLQEFLQWRNESGRGVLLPLAFVKYDGWMDCMDFFVQYAMARPLWLFSFPWPFFIDNLKKRGCIRKGGRDWLY